MESTVHIDKNFNGINFIEQETTQREFEKCVFTNCDFSNAVFASSKFIDCVFNGCNLSMVKLKNCQLNDVAFKDCKILGVNFSDCIDFLFTVKFENCILNYSIFSKKKMHKTAFINSSLTHVDFTSCDLTKSIFTNTDLLNTVFNSTNLKEVDFSSAFNININPETNQIKKAKFSVNGALGLLNKYDIVVE